MNSRFTDEQIVLCDDAFLSPEELELKNFLIENRKRIEQSAKEAKEEEDRLKAAQINYEVVLYYPHDIEGKEVELDEDAFKLIEAWTKIPSLLKQAIVAIAKIRGAA